MAEGVENIVPEDDLPGNVKKGEVVSPDDLPTSLTSGAKKKYTLTIEFGRWYFRINGRGVGIRNPFYFKD